MKVLLDTNVLVAALVARGVCADLEHCVRTHTVVSSCPLLDELSDVLVRKVHQRRHRRQRSAVLYPFRDIRILTPTAFWKWEAEAHA